MNELQGQHDESPTMKFMVPNKTVYSPAEVDRHSTVSLNERVSTHVRQQKSALDQKLDRSTFNPILTPSGDRGTSMILLSPSRSIIEALTTLASNTGQQLETIWDEVGYSPDDRASQLNELLVKFTMICEEKIIEEKGVAETFRQTIIEAKDEIVTTAKALRVDLDSLKLNAGSVQTLTDELSCLEITLEKLRTVASEAKHDLRESSEYIIEAHKALDIEMDPTYIDIESDLTKNRRDLFRCKKAEMKEELTSRMNAVIQLVQDCQQLMNDLRMEPESNGSKLDRRIAGSLVRSKDGSFIMASKFRSETCVGITSQALEELSQYVGELHSEKRRRKEKLQVMGGEIAILWEKLRIPDEEQLAFTKSVQGLGTDTIAKGEQELQRLRLLKSQVIGKLIEEARSTIKELWEQINVAEDVRSTFQPFFVRNEALFNDDLLEKHEDYIGKLVARLEQRKPILRLIERRETIIRERTQYEELQKDPERLKQRGAALTRQLLEEEKMAKRIKKELPRLTSLVVEKIEEWKAINAEDFLFEGESYLDVICRQENEWNEYKTEEYQRKLKKKQEESLVENRFVVAQSVSGASHQLKKVTVLGNRTLSENYKNGELQTKSRSHSRDPVKRSDSIREFGHPQPLSTRM